MYCFLWLFTNQQQHGKFLSSVLLDQQLLQRETTPECSSCWRLQVKMYGIHWDHFQLVKSSSNSDSDFCPKWSWTLVCCRTTKAWKHYRRGKAKLREPSIHNEELTPCWSELKWETWKAAGKVEVSTKIGKEVLELLKQRGQKGEAILQLPRECQLIKMK